MDGEPEVGISQPKDGEDYYTLTIGYPLDLAIGEALGWTMSDSTVNMARESLLVILSCVSSTPQELYDNLLYDLYYAQSGEETLGSDWTVVGDSQIRVSFSESWQAGHRWVFHIKQK